MAISDFIGLRIIPALLTAIILYYPYAYIFDPMATMKIFEWNKTPSPSDHEIFHTLLALLAVKVLFMAATLGAATFFGSKRALGWTLLGISGVAAGDGFFVLKFVGHGQWNHWKYGTVVHLLGHVLLGALDFQT